MEKTPLISIVVPVYKTEKYIHQSIDSLVSQTYRNLEILLVDDGSPDTCPHICDNYALKDSRIVVIHKENGGLSSARQAGIEAATGDYLMIVDSDDWIDPDTVENCVHIASMTGCDCVMFAYVREYGNNSIPNPLFNSDYTYDLSQSEENVHRRLIGPVGSELSAPQKVDNFSSVCMKLYRIDIARKGKIVSERIVGTSEDTIFNIYALDGCCISYLNRCYYHYRKDNAQSITAHHKPDLSEKWDVLYQFFQEYISSCGQEKQYQHAFLNRVACGMIGLGLNEVGSTASLIKKSKHIRSMLNKPLYLEAFRQIDCSFCPMQWKVFFSLCRHRLAFSLTLLLQFINFLRSRATV